MKRSLAIFNFLEEISSLSYSIVFLYFFALITEEGFLISPRCSLKLCIQMGISFLFPLPLPFSYWKANFRLQELGNTFACHFSIQVPWLYLLLNSWLDKNWAQNIINVLMYPMCHEKNNHKIKSNIFFVKQLRSRSQICKTAQLLYIG